MSVMSPKLSVLLSSFRAPVDMNYNVNDLSCMQDIKKTVLDTFNTDLSLEIDKNG